MKIHKLCVHHLFKYLGYSQVNSNRITLKCILTPQHDHEDLFHRQIGTVFSFLFS